MVDFGILSLIPPLLVIVLAIVLRSSFEPLLIGCLVGFILIETQGGPSFFGGFIEALYQVMKDEETIWVILVCGLYGSLIGLLVRSGSAFAFGYKVLQRVRTPRASLMSAWLLGIFLFLDDYLSALTTGTTLKKVTDHFRIPREMLAYIVNTTAPAVCVLVPISTWTLFIGSILEDAQLATSGGGNQLYWSIIPFVLYGWISVLLVPFVILGWIPLIGKMRKAYRRVVQTGQLTQTSMPQLTVIGATFENSKRGGPWHFILPLVVLLAATIWFRLDALKGVMVAVVFTFLLYLFARMGRFSQLSETVFTGFNSMVFALALVVMSYVLKEVGNQMGLTTYVIENVRPLLSKEWLPAILFLSIGAIAWATGSSWGLYAVVIPIVIPLAESMGAPVLVSIGAIVSAGVWGANACLFSDATILTAQATDTNNVDHALSQLPYALLSFFLSLIGYLALGFWY